MATFVFIQNKSKNITYEKTIQGYWHITDSYISLRI
jgi:hypothetical protein